MRYVLLALKVLLFVAVLSFALKNSDAVTVRYFLGAEWQAPLIFVLLVVFCAGAAFGVVACLGTLFRQRREIARLKRSLPGSQADRAGAEAPRSIPVQATRNGN